MSELQPGMLALVIGCYKNPEHIGKIVTIVSEAPEKAIEKYGHGFIIKGVEPQKWALSKHLKPIRPEADPLDQKQQQELHA